MWLRAAVFVALAGPFGQLGCLAGVGEECTTDGDCADDGECTRTNECVPDGAAVRVTVRWTIDGAAPSPSQPDPCAPIGELEVLFHDPGSEPQNYRPVPCDLGQTVYDKMPPRFESVEVVAYDPTDRVVDSEEKPLDASGESILLFELTP